MPTDRTVYTSLEDAYNKIQEFFDNNQFGPEHFKMILKHEELRNLLDSLNIKAIEEQSDNLVILHEQFKDIKKASDEVIKELNNVVDSLATAAKVVSWIDNILSKIKETII